MGKQPRSRKTPEKRPISSNYRPISCLPVMWKNHCTNQGGDILLASKPRAVFRKTEKNYHLGQCADPSDMVNRAMASTTKRPMIPQSWLISCIFWDNLYNKVITEAMKNCKVELTRGITQERYLPGKCAFYIKFVIAMMQSNYILRCKRGHKFFRIPRKNNQLMYIDDIKLFAQNKLKLIQQIHN